MVSDAVFYMCKYIDKFDTEKTNPFTYFTTVAKNAFLQNIESYNSRDAMFTSLEYIDNIEDFDGN
jgi:DNA-directed RNA polymerase specialized sigma24 family protein